MKEKVTIIPSQDDPLLSPSTVAKLFDVKSYTVRKWIEEGKLDATKIGNRWRIRHSEMVRFANTQYGDRNEKD